MSSLPEYIYSPEEYLELERKADHKSEYRFGHIIAMAGATPEHITISVNVVSSLHSQLRGRPCRVYSNDLRVKAAVSDVYTYPDVSVVCGELQFDERDSMTVVNPTVLIEVLSPSTAAYDRGNKFIYYQQLQSLKDYLLISQSEPRIEHFSRQENGLWLPQVAQSLPDAIHIASIQCALLMADVYEGIRFGE